MENKKDSEFKTSVGIIKNAVNKSFKTHKALWGIGIAILIIAILFTILSAVMRQDDFLFNVVDHFVPEQISSTDEHPYDLTFYREVNPEYLESDTKIDGDNYIQIYRYYYLDTNNNKVYLPEGQYHYIAEDGSQQITYVGLSFVVEAGQRVSKLINALNIIKWVLIVAFIVGLIVLWYFKDKKRYEESRPKRLRKADNKNQ